MTMFSKRIDELILWQALGPVKRVASKLDSERVKWMGY